MIFLKYRKLHISNFVEIWYFHVKFWIERWQFQNVLSRNFIFPIFRNMIFPCQILNWKMTFLKYFIQKLHISNFLEIWYFHFKFWIERWHFQNILSRNFMFPIFRNMIFPCQILNWKMTFPKYFIQKHHISKFFRNIVFPSQIFTRNMIFPKFGKWKCHFSPSGWFNP